MKEVSEIPEVTIYTKPGCPYCAAAKEDLEKRGVAYKEVNVQGDEKALEEMLKYSEGVRCVPVFVEDGKAVVGEGNLNFPKILEKLQTLGKTKYMLVEQDDCYGERAFDCLKRSYDNVRKMGY